MKFKKTLAVLSAAVMTLGASGSLRLAAFSEEYTEEDAPSVITEEENPNARYAYAVSVSGNIALSGKNIICNSKISGNNKVTKITAEQFLEKKVKTGWNVACSWVKSANGSSLNMTNYMPVLAGTFRLRTVFKVYSGKKYETITKYSGAKTFSVKRDEYDEADMIPDETENEDTTRGTGEFKNPEYLHIGNIGYLKYEPDEYGNPGSIEITDIAMSASEVIIPEEIDGLPVTKIVNGSFVDHPNITKVVVPDCATNWFVDIFRGCVNLESINIPEGVTGLGDKMFQGCASLRTIDIPESVEHLSRAAFKDCTALESITLPDGMKSIDNQCFEGCTSLKSINIPDSVYFLGKDAFNDTPLLKKSDGVYYVENWVAGVDKDIVTADIIAGTKGICAFAFEDCKDLSSLTLHEGLKKLGYGMVRNCSNLKRIELPEGLTEIYQHAFYRCPGLESVRLPEGLKTIGFMAFSDCPKLKDINIPDSIEEILKDSFCNTAVMDSQKKAKYINKWLVDVSLGVKNLNIRPDTKYIAPIACYFKDIEAVDVPQSVEVIYEGAFRYCSDLKSITIHNPNCEIKEEHGTISTKAPYDPEFDGNYTIEFTGTIYGYENSTAQEYAEKYGYKFESLGEYTGPEPVTGDVDGDGRISVKDAAMLCRLLANGQREKISDNADFNHDGKINVRDVSAIANFLVTKS